MNICPAILTDSVEEFTRELTEYTPFFKWIDIDVNVKVDNFKGKVTVPVEKFLPLIEKYQGNFFNIHLMTEFPLEEIKKVVNSPIFNNLRFIIHQESRVDNQIFTLLGRNKIAATLEVGSELMSLEYYKKFSEVQFMTVDVGYQGSKFEEKVLDKAQQLVDLGFDDVISLDGGVNAETATIISKYPIVQRVSVGSYFSKSQDVKNSLKELTKAFSKKQVVFKLK